MIAEKPMIESPAACVDVPVGFKSPMLFSRISQVTASPDA